MAKEKTKKKADKKSEKTEAPANGSEFKYTVETIAEKLGKKPASVRVQLRNKGIEKAGKSYGWNTKAELEEVIDQLNSEDEKPAKKAPKKAPKADKEKPSKGAKAKKAKTKAPADDEDEDDE